jgi:hypothetical protein
MKEFKNDFNEKFKKVPVSVNHSLLLAEQLPEKMYSDVRSIGNEWSKLLNDAKVTTFLFGKPARVKGMVIMDFNKIESDSEKISEMRELVKVYHIKPGGIFFQEQEQEQKGTKIVH